MRRWLYIGRDNKGGAGGYTFSPVKPIWQHYGEWSSWRSVWFCASDFEKFSNLRLAPGELVRVPYGSKIVFPAYERVAKK